MKQIEDLWVKVTYEVRLGDLEIPKEALYEIIDSSESGWNIKMGSDLHSEAYEWLNENIKERDCCEWEAEIIEVISNDSNEADA